MSREKKDLLMIIHKSEIGVNKIILLYMHDYLSPNFYYYRKSISTPKFFYILLLYKKSVIIITKWFSLVKTIM